MSEPSYFTHEEYALTKVALERSDVPPEALALLSVWIEEERLLVDDREDVGGISFCRMDARVMAPLPHVLASFFARRPYKRKEGHYPNWNGFYLLLYGMSRRAGSCCAWEGILPTRSSPRSSQRESRRSRRSTRRAAAIGVIRKRR